MANTDKKKCHADAVLTFANQSYLLGYYSVEQLLDSWS